MTIYVVLYILYIYMYVYVCIDIDIHIQSLGCVLCQLEMPSSSMPEPPVNHHEDGQFTIWTLW